MSDLRTLQMNLLKLISANPIIVFGRWVSGVCLVDGLRVGPNGMCHINDMGMIAVHISEQAKQEMDAYSSQEGADDAIQEWFGMLYNASSEWYGSDTYDEEPPKSSEWLYLNLQWPAETVPDFDDEQYEDIVEAVDEGAATPPTLIPWSRLNEDNKATIIQNFNIGDKYSNDCFFEGLRLFIIETIGGSISSDSATYAWTELVALAEK